jgi:hypothetical protein
MPKIVATDLAELRRPGKTPMFFRDGKRTTREKFNADLEGALTKGYVTRGKSTKGDLYRVAIRTVA